MPLMVYEDYKKGHWKWPYVYTIKGKKGSIYYFGEIHSYNIKNKQWIKHEALWKKFLADANKKKVVMVEGGVGRAEPTRTESIRKGGGMGLTEFAARESKIKLLSPEPREDIERKKLEKLYSRDEIQYEYFVRVAHQWTRTEKPRMLFSKYMQRYLDADKKRSGWRRYDFSLAHMKRIHKKLFGTIFSEKDTQFLEKASDPYGPFSIVCRVACASSRIRDEYIVQKIVAYTRKGYSIFVHYGGSHAVVQRPLLAELLN